MLDSGCSFRMCAHASWFDDLAKISNEKVYMVIIIVVKLLVRVLISRD